MIRFVIRNIATKGFIRSTQYVGGTETTDPSKAKQWRTYDGAHDAIKDLTFRYYLQQLEQTHGKYANRVMLQQQNFAAVYELVEVNFTPTIANSTSINITVNVGSVVAYGFAPLEIS